MRCATHLIIYVCCTQVKGWYLRHRADGWVNYMYGGTVGVPAPLPCASQHTFYCNMESPVYYPDSFGPLYEVRHDCPLHMLASA